MNLKLKLPVIIILLVWQAQSVLVYSQADNSLNGKIINSANSEPVPFATIKLKYKQLGVFANAEGDFRISQNPDFKTDSIIITCIGFKRSSLPYSALSDKRVNRIFLTQAIYGLGEVKIEASRRKLSSSAIIARAIRNIKENYPVKPFSYVSYYRDYQKDGNYYLNLNEAIIQTLDNGFDTKSI